MISGAAVTRLFVELRGISSVTPVSEQLFPVDPGALGQVKIPLHPKGSRSSVRAMSGKEKNSNLNESRRSRVGAVLFLVLLFLAASTAVSANSFDFALNSSGVPQLDGNGQSGDPASGPAGAVFAEPVVEFESDSDDDLQAVATLPETRADMARGRRPSRSRDCGEHSAAFPTTDPSRGPPPHTHE